MTTKENKQALVNDPTDIRYYLHQPHDKYVRALLQHQAAALQIIDFALDEGLRKFIDFGSLKLSNNSFLDEKLQLSFADVCYEGRTQTQKPFRICLLFEHKSEASARLYEQLNRYINNVWLEDQKQDRASTLSIPILIYHGATPIEKEHPAAIFPEAPAELLRFVPHFDYVILDIAALPEEEIDNRTDLSALKNVFLALKYGRNEEYLRKNLKKVVIFARRFHSDPNIQLIIQYTLLYMVSISKTVQNALENPSNSLTVEEEELVLPYVFEKYRIKYMEEGLEKGMEEGFEKGMEKGIEKGLEKGIEKGVVKGLTLAIHKFIQKNPALTDQEIADLFEVDILLVSSARQS